MRIKPLMIESHGEVQDSHRLQILISETEIQQRIQQLAEEISQAYTDQPLTLLGVMTGSLLFLTDLMKQLKVPHQVGVLQASSYAGARTSPGSLRTNLDFLPDIQNRNVLLIDDILDTGQTLQQLVSEIERLQPASLKTAVLLWKKARTQVPLTPDYLGFPIEDLFVVGYGLDYADDYRHLPAIHTLQFHSAS